MMLEQFHIAGGTGGTILYNCWNKFKQAWEQIYITGWNNFI
jgi:hypothetical protein